MITGLKYDKQDKLARIKLEFNTEKDINLLRDIISLSEQQVQYYSEFSSGLMEMIATLKKSL